MRDQEMRMEYIKSNLCRLIEQLEKSGAFITMGEIERLDKETIIYFTGQRLRIHLKDLYERYERLLKYLNLEEKYIPGRPAHYEIRKANPEGDRGERIGTGEEVS